MWAPADLFTPTINAVTLALKRAVTFGWDNLPLVLGIVALIVVALVVIAQLRRRPR